MAFVTICTSTPEPGSEILITTFEQRPAGEFLLKLDLWPPWGRPSLPRAASALWRSLESNRNDPACGFIHPGSWWHR